MTSEHLLVKAPSHSYPIIIGYQMDMAQQIIPYITGHQVLIVSNETVAPLYLDNLKAGLASKFAVFECILPDGEIYKTQESITKIYDVLMNNHCGRDITLVA